MSSETVVTFLVDVDADVDAVAALLVANLTGQGVACSEPSPIGSGVRIEATIGSRRVPLFVGSTDQSGQWFLTIGTAAMPLAKLLGVKDAEVRSGLAAAVDAALAETPAVRRVEWHEEDAWFGSPPPRRRWWPFG